MKEKIARASRQNRYTAEEQKKVLLRWKKSSLSKKNFCKAEGIAPSTLYKWMNQRDKKLKAGIPTHLSPVMLIEKAETEKVGESIPIEICLPNRTLMRFNLSVKELVFFAKELCHAIATIR
jgi:hypothetical protein